MKRTYSLTVFTLAISLFIYLFYRTEKTVVNELIIFFLSFETYTTIKNSIKHLLPLNEPVVFSLPGGLWVFCTTVLSKEFYLKVKDHKLQMVVVPLLFAIGLEVLQLMQVANGRFDFWDVGCYLLFGLLGYYAIQPHKSQQNLIAPFTLSSFICLASLLAVYLAHVRQ